MNTWKYLEVTTLPAGTRVIKMVEPGGQSEYKRIYLTFEEARDIFLELADLLEEEELRKEN